MGVDSEANMAHVALWDRVHGIEPDMYISAQKADGRKCARCWKICGDTDFYEWADVCARCNRVLCELWRDPVRRIALRAL